jgi:hypothetical protein
MDKYQQVIKLILQPDSGVMVSVLTSSVVDRGFEPRLGQTEDCEIGEWLVLNANSALFQIYHGENKLIFEEKMIRSALF